MQAIILYTNTTLLYPIFRRINYPNFWGHFFTAPSPSPLFRQRRETCTAMTPFGEILMLGFVLSGHFMAHHIKIALKFYVSAKLIHKSIDFLSFIPY